MITDPLTEAELARVIELDAKATKGPWHVSENRHPTTDGEPWGSVEAVRHPAGGAGSYPTGMTITWRGGQGRTNAGALATFRALCPRLARELLATREKLRVAREALEKIAHSGSELDATWEMRTAETALALT